MCDLWFKAFASQMQAFGQDREKVFLQLTYLRGQHLLGKPRALGDHNWEPDVFLASNPGDVAVVSVINKI